MSQLIRRGEIWLADLNPIQGSEQAGIRPIIIFQNDLSRFPIFQHYHYHPTHHQPASSLSTHLFSNS